MWPFGQMLALCRSPLYPPKSISFEIGFSQDHMQPVPGRYQIQLTDHVQTFELPVSSSVGHFLKINLHGKVQQQLEDRQFFTAIRCVKAIGQCLPAAAVYETSLLIRGGQLLLHQICNMPVLAWLQLQNTTGHSRYCSFYRRALTAVIVHSFFLIAATPACLCHR